MEMRRGRKRSWVGVNEEKPYSYLREAMVAGLMKGICRDGNEEAITQAKISVPSDRRDVVAKAIGQWNFSAHSFSDDELLYAGLLMFTHALEMPGMEKWRIGSDQLINYLVACRAAYNNFVPYHNWRHVVDVLQATFSFLVVQGCLPAYSVGAKTLTPRKSPFTALIEPFEAITLLITAIGHDVGHPGVNNGFLVTLNSPLAQLYNDKSVLESFHCAAYSQILRRYWYSAFEDVAMRKLMISSILATDMGLHNDYMKKLADVTALLAENRSTADWTPKMIQDNKALACSLIIKCADICNVAREYSTAVQWMHILSKEFARQAVMEQDLRIPTSLMAPPKNDMQSLCHGQLGFMNLFAIPLFNQVAAIMPQMQFTVDQLAKNKVLFEDFSQIVSAQASAVPEDMSPPVADTEHEEAPEADAVSCMDFDVSATGPPSSAGRDMELRPRTCGRISAPRHQHLIISPAPISPSPISPRQRGLSTTSSQPPDDREISFMSVADFAASDPFGSQTEECHSSGLINPSTQRHSETTEGSNSLPSSSDWASQANSATGKLPLSPSTRGTSINSQSDIQEETPVPDVPVRIVYPEDTATPTPTNLASYSQSPDEHQPASRGNSIGRAEGKTITKRPSRFRLNTFNLFKRHRSPPPVPMPMGDGQSPS